MDNYHFVMDHNSINAEQDGFTMELNMFSDLTNEEYKQRLGLKSIVNDDPSQTCGNWYEFDKKKKVAASFDWRSKGVVNPIKD